ncbi:hypothetical protein SNEBB_006294 [Seison nebaliae]|nr:hypothetical protein SNEBB_006294 [Seison nebaliae]
MNEDYSKKYSLKTRSNVGLSFSKSMPFKSNHHPRIFMVESARKSNVNMERNDMKSMLKRFEEKNEDVHHNKIVIGRSATFIDVMSSKASSSALKLTKKLDYFPSILNEYHLVGMICADEVSVYFVGHYSPRSEGKFVRRLSTTNLEVDVEKKLSSDNQQEKDDLMMLYDEIFIKYFAPKTLNNTTKTSKIEKELHIIRIIDKYRVILKNWQNLISNERQSFSNISMNSFILELQSTHQTNNNLFEIFEYINGGRMDIALKSLLPLSPANIAFFGAQIALTIGYLHRICIIHRNINLASFMMDVNTGYIKLCELNLCKKVKPEFPVASSLVGLPTHNSPEMFLMKGYSYPTDWWSFGVILYQLSNTFGNVPFGKLPKLKLKNGQISMICGDFELFQIYEDAVRNFPKYPTCKFFRKCSLLAKDITDTWEESYNDVYSVIKKLLRIKQHLRLGSKNDYEEIKEQQLFSNILWQDLEDRKFPIPSPLNISPLHKDLSKYPFCFKESNETLGKNLFHNF